MKLWYVVFKTEDGRVLFGYFTASYLKERDLLLDTTVIEAKTKILPEDLSKNIAYKSIL